MSTITTYTLEQFGGVEDTDVTTALAALLAAVNAAGGNALISISAGTWHYKHTEELENAQRWLIDCNNIEVAGAGVGVSVMKVLDGALSRGTNPPESNDKFSEGWGWIFENCVNVYVHDLTLNGNLANLDITNEDQDGSCFGLQFEGCALIKVADVAITGFGASNVNFKSLGATGATGTGTTPCSNATFSNVVADNARVNNMEINSLLTGTFTLCEFNDAHQIIAGNIGAGVNIEVVNIVDDVLFDRCTWEGNQQFGVLMNRTNNLDGYRTIDFRDCTITATEGWATWTRDRETTFHTCTINGGSTHMGAKFLTCEFNIDDTHEKTWACLSVDDSALWMANCTITASGSKRLMSLQGSTTAATKKTVKNCTFIMEDSTLASQTFVVILDDEFTFRNNKFPVTIGTSPVSPWRMSHTDSVVKADNALYTDDIVWSPDYSEPAAATARVQGTSGVTFLGPISVPLTPGERSNWLRRAARANRSKQRPPSQRGVLPSWVVSAVLAMATAPDDLTPGQVFKRSRAIGAALQYLAEKKRSD